MQFVRIINNTYPERGYLDAEYCDSFLKRFRGLMLRSSLRENEGLLLVEPHESRSDSSIHMLFMRFDIAVIWIDRNYQVVDVKLAKKWRLAYVPDHPAQYILEAHGSRLHDFHIGDRLTFENI
jgi:uncharacterized membrane protein (UPF0127 family)